MHVWILWLKRYNTVDIFLFQDIIYQYLIHTAKYFHFLTIYITMANNFTFLLWAFFGHGKPISHDTANKYNQQHCSSLIKLYLPEQQLNYNSFSKRILIHVIITSVKSINTITSTPSTLYKSVPIIYHIYVINKKINTWNRQNEKS